MSDFYVLVIPTDVTWQPTMQAANEAEVYVRRMFAVPDGVRDVTVKFSTSGSPRPMRARSSSGSPAPAAVGTSPLSWYFDLIEQTGGTFDNLTVVVPCCGSVVGLDSLAFDWPSGFARFEIAVANPVRAVGAFTAEELDVIAAILGHPVRQILAHV